jgi:hypothetical protein
VIEAVTAESAARGLTGGSRASRAPREAGALHLTLIESSELPVFRVEMGLRGRIHPADCSCGALTNRLEMETPFLGPLLLMRSDLLEEGDSDGMITRDPLDILRAASSAPGVHRAALVQEAPGRLRVLLASRHATQDDTARTIEAAARKHLEPLFIPSDIEVIVEAGEESKLPFPERGFVQGFGVEPILSIAESSA